MILRPVRPESPCGPPTTKLPVGLTWIWVDLVISLAGTIGLMTVSIIASRICFSFTVGACWVDTTMASTPTIWSSW